MLAMVVGVLGTMAAVAILGCGQPGSGTVPQAAEQAIFASNFPGIFRRDGARIVACY